MYFAAPPIAPPHVWTCPSACRRATPRVAAIRWPANAMALGVPNPGSRVFTVAPRQVVESAGDYQAANDQCRRLTGKGLSRQAFALFAALRDVDRHMTPELQNRVVETFPELVFARMAGRTLHSKHTALGCMERAEALGLDAETLAAMLDAGGIKAARSEDALDALALVKAATHVARIENIHASNPRRLPGDDATQYDAKGLRMEIWF